MSNDPTSSRSLIPRPPLPARQPGEPWTDRQPRAGTDLAAALRRLDSDTMRRVAALELALADRRVRRRLRREIRQGQRNFAWASTDPLWVRAEAAFNAWLRPVSAERGHCGEAHLEIGCEHCPEPPSTTARASPRHM